MLIYQPQELILEWMNEQGIGLLATNTAKGFLWWDHNTKKPSAGFAVFDCNGKNGYGSLVAYPGPSYKTFTNAVLLYVFAQLKLVRLTFIIEQDNLRSIRLVTALGAIHEATLRNAGISGDLLVYALFPENCKLWRRLNAKSESSRRT